MSSLDHNLVCANSLTGIGTVDEAMAALEPDRKWGMPSTIVVEIERELMKARELLTTAANSAEASKAEVAAAAKAARDAREAAMAAKLIFDAAVAYRTGILESLESGSLDEIERLAKRSGTQAELAALQPGHMPYLFPEVFLREPSGFDCIIGNPPWEELMADRLDFWGLRFPGLKGMRAVDRERELTKLQRNHPDLAEDFAALQESVERQRQVISSGPYPGIGTGDIDLYKAFSWRFLNLLRNGGRAGVVLPRSAVSAAGSAEWRRAVLETGSFEDVCLLTNGAGWVFPEIDVRYTVSLTTLSKASKATVAFCGPFHSLEDYLTGRDERAEVTKKEFATWSDTLSFPRVPDATAGDILRQMKAHPRFDSTEGFEFRPVAELHATNDRGFFDTDIDHAGIPVLTGGSFEIWNPDFGPPYGVANRAKLRAHLLSKSKRGVSMGSSAFHGMSFGSADDLPMSHARIAFRDITNSTNQRTSIFCLVPPDVALVNKAPYLLRRKGSEIDEAYLLGIVSSIPFDWYTRRWVELNMNFFILNPCPVPRPPSTDPLRRRVVELAGSLAAVDSRFQVWADRVSVGVGTLASESKRFGAIAELDALSSLLYGLTWPQVAHVFATFHRGWDYTKRLDRVKHHYDAWVLRA
jgi:hypothetical protein